MEYDHRVLHVSLFVLFFFLFYFSPCSFDFVESLCRSTTTRIDPSCGLCESRCRSAGRVRIVTPVDYSRVCVFCWWDDAAAS